MKLKKNDLLITKIKRKKIKKISTLMCVSEKIILEVI
jgi:hypothetical protein